MYSYCNNNPIKYTDPSGHFIILPMLGLLAGVGIGGFIINNVIQNNNAKNQIKSVQKNQNVPDKTKELNNKLNQSASETQKNTAGQNIIQKLDTFKNAVDTGSKYDLKNQGWDQTIKYNGIIMEPQDIGNFHYGYIGRSIGIAKSILIIGGGYNQHYGSNSNDIWCFTLSFCDDPRDVYYIKMGAIKYDNEN